MINRRQALQAISLGIAGSLGCAQGVLNPVGLGKGSQRSAKEKPNILFAIADDWSWPHAGVYADRVVKTPVFDRIAHDGILFTNAYCAAPTCTASRGAVLSGQAIHRLGEGANLHSTLTPDIPLYTDLLEANGYAVGMTGKGWAPGNFQAGGRTRNPAGTAYKDFGSFLDQKQPDQPFCFWFGSINPHRPYDRDSGVRSGMSPDAVEVPPFLPDTPEVRRDILDYYYEVQAFDTEVGRLLDTLEARGLSDNTLIVMTSDNGMPFPRAKTTLYGSGTHMPLAIHWPAGIQNPGRVVDGLISFTDF
ncbi:MAG TPA: sulfatase, partial [bacterium]|nr:sulfatase [bacterium]